MNVASLTGRIATDLELHRTKNNIEVCGFILAVKRPHNQKVTDFLRIVVWRQDAVFVSKYFEKGQLIEVTGSITSRKMDGSIVIEVVADEIHALEYRKKTVADTTEKKGEKTTDVKEELPEEQKDNTNIDKMIEKMNKEAVEWFCTNTDNGDADLPGDEEYYRTLFGIPQTNENE